MHLVELLSELEQGLHQTHTELLICLVGLMLNFPQFLH